MPGWNGEFEPELLSLYSGINVFYPLTEGCLKFTFTVKWIRSKVLQETMVRLDPIVLSNLNETIFKIQIPRGLPQGEGGVKASN